MAKKKPAKPKSRSGTSRSYADRKAKGKPNVTFSLSQETVTLVADLAESHETSRSAIVELAVRELSEKEA